MPAETFPDGRVEVADLDRKMIDQSLKNIEGLLDGEEESGVIAMLHVAKDALERVKERRGMN